MKTRNFILLVFGLVFSGKTNAQPPTVRNLVFEGGGVRGVAFTGALLALQQRHALDSLQRVAGTSVGAIHAVLLAVGYSPAEIGQYTETLNVRKMNDGKALLIGNMGRMLRRFGWYRGDYFRDWLGQLIAQKTGDKELTFRKLHELARQGKGLDLFVTGTNLTRQQTGVFSHLTHPDMQVVDAVRISISIPLYYQPVFLDAQGCVVHQPRRRDYAYYDLWVDGGVLLNFPIRVFDDRRFATGPAADSTGPFVNPQTLGLRLDRPEQIAFDHGPGGLAPYRIGRFQDYMQAFFNLIYENVNRQPLHSADWPRTISISTLNMGPRAVRLKPAERDRLLESGHAAVRAFYE